MAALDSQKLERFNSMNHVERRNALGQMVWGYGDDVLSADDLIDILGFSYGPSLADQFLNAMSCGFNIPGKKSIQSFAGACVFYNRLDLLEKVLSTLLVSQGSKLESQSPSAADLLDLLSTRTTETEAQIHYSLFLMAATMPPTSKAAETFKFALGHHPNHPDIAIVLDTSPSALVFQKQSAPVLREVMMKMQIDRSLERRSDSVSSGGNATRPKRAL